MSSQPVSTILVVDDDIASLDSLCDVLTQAGYQVVPARSGAEALEKFEGANPDLVLTDLRMREIDGLKVLEAIRALRKEIPVIVMTAFTSMETAMTAIRSGAYDYVSKPFKLEHLRMVVGRALEQSRLLKENKRLRTLVEEKQAQDGMIIGRSPQMVELYKVVARVAPLATTVLIQGESGTGKELVARLIHNHSVRQGAFMAVNCGALAEGLLESELFGHVKGSFTGAVASKVGIFEAAQGGTCFLDEISNTTLSLQMKLLRVLEEREVVRVGSTEAIPVNARVIAASNQPLDALVRDGRFREDLFYRLKVVTIQLPPLRERQADIPLLLDHFVRHYATASAKEIAIAEEVYPMLCSYPWPGNVRELANAVERAIALNSSGVLTLQDFHDQTLSEKSDEVSPGSMPENSSGAGRKKTLAEKERDYIMEVLASTHQNVSKAAEILDIDRRTLYRILQRAGMQPKQE